MEGILSMGVALRGEASRRGGWMAVTCFGELVAPHKGHGLASKRVAAGAMFFCEATSSNSEASADLQWESESSDVRSPMVAATTAVGGAAGWERERERSGSAGFSPGSERGFFFSYGVQPDQAGGGPKCGSGALDVQN